MSSLERNRETRAAHPESREFIDQCQPEFRAITTPFGRVGIRLEVTFWRALEAVSGQEGRSVSALVSDIVGEAKKGGINATSALRCYVMRRYLQDSELLELVSTPLKRSMLLQSGPFPSIAVTRAGEIVSASSGFAQYLQASTNLAFLNSDVVRIRFDLPFDALLAKVSNHEFFECGMLIIHGAVERRTVARVIGLPPKPCDSVVAYILQ